MEELETEKKLDWMEDLHKLLTAEMENGTPEGVMRLLGKAPLPIRSTSALKEVAQ